MFTVSSIYVVMVDSGQGSAPAGWYNDGHGHRWWDGTQWGPYAPAAPGYDPNDKTFAILSHLGMLVGGFVPALVLYLISTDSNRPMTRWHAREALNFQITFTIVWLIGFALMFGSIVSSAATESIPFGVFIFPLMFLLYGGAMVLSVIGSIRASQLKQWRYPVSIRFIKG